MAKCAIFLIILLHVAISVRLTKGGRYGQTGPRAVSDERYRLLLDIIDGKLPARRYQFWDRETKSAIRQYERMKKGFTISVDNLKTADNDGRRIFLDNKELLRLSDIKKKVKKTFLKSKGSGIKKVNHKISKSAIGASRCATGKVLKSLTVFQKTRPVFDNKAPLHPISANRIHERHQIDLVDFAKHEAIHKGITYKYILSVLDVFSRFLWLRAIPSKSSKYVARELSKIYVNEGYPDIIQCDNGLEFHGEVNRFCEKKGIKIIRSSARHPQSQGKVEASHKVWKRKIRFDYSQNGVTNWAKRLNSYAKIRNEEYHTSIGATPFEVYFGRTPTTAKATPGNEDISIRDHLDNAADIRKRALSTSKRKAKEMVSINLSRHMPSRYYPGEEVLIKPGATRGSFSKTDAIQTGVVVSANHKTHMYKVRVDNKHTIRCSVNRLAAKTRSEDIEKRSANRFKRIHLPCQCLNDNCLRKADVTCSFNKARRCCQRESKGCKATHHKKLHFNIEDFYKKDNNISAFFESIASFQRSNAISASARDHMIRNALQYDLVPVGDTPKDGNCMFHAVAESIRAIDGIQITHDKVRAEVINYLRNNRFTRNEMDLADFVPNLSWSDYLDSLNYEWGDHICLMAISQIYNVGIGVVSSNTPEIRFLETDEVDGSNRMIYLGHEFEFHYQHLLPIAAPLPDLRGHSSSRAGQTHPNGTQPLSSAPSSPIFNATVQPSPSASTEAPPSPSANATAPPSPSPNATAPPSPIFNDTAPPSPIFNAKAPPSPFASTAVPPSPIFNAATPPSSSANAATPPSPSANIQSQPLSTDTDTTLSDLPNEMLSRIFSMVLECPGYTSMIGMLRDISPESDRLQGVIDKCYYDGEFYMNPILMKDVLNCHNSIPGSIHKVSVAKIIKRAGRSSGAAERLKNLLAKYKRWFYCVLWLMTLPNPGWFRIVNSRPGKGGW